MTVKELINILEKMPQDMLVYDDGSYEPETPENIFIGESYINGTDTTIDVVYI